MVSDRPSDRLPTLVVDDPRAPLGDLAARVYGHPSKALSVVGVTGTNGKTTTTYFLEAGLRAAGRHAGVVGTIETHVDGRPLPSVRTTPEAPDLQALLALMREEDVEAVALEVSSHGLAQGRVDGTQFAVGVFTNLTHDHLDYHHDMARYWAAKASLFRPSRCAVAVVEVDDAYGLRLAHRTAVPEVVTTSSRGRDASWRAGDVRADGWQTAFRLTGPGVRRDARIRFPGRFNVDNALNAVAALHALGLDVDAVLEGIAGLDAVPGRLQRVRCGQPFEAIVDYAHNPAALHEVLVTLRRLTPGCLAVVLGATGDRDHAKRPLMGRIAARGADLVVVTDDDPFSEDPAAIRAAVLHGARAHADAPVLCVPDRAEAIAVAVARMGPGDTLLVAGRGHEPLRFYGARTFPFADAEVLAGALRGAA
jgi:UDP-N-acetylmuramoyl-L-alanyl-D-glutamate--2,6-diaminopimelate ligase